MVYGTNKIESQIRSKIFSFKPRFSYCPKCYITDFKSFGEAYWRISHQIPSIFICPIHQIPLEEINTPYYELELNTKINIDVHNIPRMPLSKKTLFHAKTFTRQSFYLNKINLKLYEKVKSNKFYLLFIERGFVKPSGKIDVTKLQSEIEKFYGIEFLEIAKFNKEIYKAMEQDPLSWRYNMAPVEFLILINFFFNSLSSFIMYSYKIPTGENGPFPCLNYFCDLFNVNTITFTSIYLKEETTKRLSINFKCNKCNFVYEKVFRISDWCLLEIRRDKSEEWISNVLSLINNNHLNIESVSKKLNINILEIEEMIFMNKLDYSNKLLRDYKNSIEWAKRDKQVLLYFKNLVSKAIGQGKVEVYHWICHSIYKINLESELSFLTRTEQYVEKHRTFYNRLKDHKRKNSKYI
ncbi:TnsD family Tn7-like transposition protein [Psychrobacillus sp. NEAU-3TGS]|uniref:TnsD family Tn7-like transposition protein n=1 Tax=Psychrobacillus sp. NEAU-3TGS TaxID=2995412 RepID=UPI00249698B4|nr:TnsD family Tn7-like transposition protein [Psychrobacillus sp. NEAU-3TGS]MDI2585832.1 TnsD family Tn7-like transposition protein [Psychrobacillus sp. NEAU-3TGS]